MAEHSAEKDAGCPSLENLSDAEALAIELWKVGTSEQFRSDENTVKNSIWMDVAEHVIALVSDARAEAWAEVVARVEAVPIAHWQTSPGPDGVRHGFMDIADLRAALTRVLPPAVSEAGR